MGRTLAPVFQVLLFPNTQFSLCTPTEINRDRLKTAVPQQSGGRPSEFSFSSNCNSVLLLPLKSTPSPPPVYSFSFSASFNIIRAAHSSLLLNFSPSTVYSFLFSASLIRAATFSRSALQFWIKRESLWASGISGTSATSLRQAGLFSCTSSTFRILSS